MSIPQYLIELLQLEPLPVEGGYFRLIYCSDETIDRSALPTRYTQAKAFGSAIYFLLHGADFSALHRLRSKMRFIIFIEVIRSSCCYYFPMVLAKCESWDRRSKLGSSLKLWHRAAYGKARGSSPVAITP